MPLNLYYSRVQQFVYVCTDTPTVTSNLALGRPVLATPSRGYHMPPESVVDGSREDWITGYTSQCYSSQEYTNPWWSVDLGSSKIIRSFVITAREDVSGTYSVIYADNMIADRVCQTFVCVSSCLFILIGLFHYAYNPFQNHEISTRTPKTAENI